MFHLELEQISRTTHLDAQNNHNQISQELVSVKDIAEDAKFGSGTSSTTRSAENLSVSGTWLRMLRLVVMVMVMMMKWSKDHLSRSRADLQGILPPYAPQKGTIGKATKWSSCRAHASFYNGQCFIGTTNWAFVKSAGCISSLDTILHRLSSYYFRAPVLPSVALPLWAWLFNKVLLCKMHAFSQLRQCWDPYQIKVSIMPKDVQPSGPPSISSRLLLS